MSRMIAKKTHTHTVYWVNATSYILLYCTACTRRLEGNRIYCCTLYAMYLVHATSFVIYFSIGCTQRLVGNRVYCCVLCRTRHIVYYIFLAVTQSPQIHTSILSCSSQILCFTANREHRQSSGRLSAQEKARYKYSYLRAFDLARPLYFESLVQRDMQEGFTDEL